MKTRRLLRKFNIGDEQGSVTVSIMNVEVEPNRVKPHIFDESGLLLAGLDVMLAFITLHLGGWAKGPIVWWQRAQTYLRRVSVLAVSNREYQPRNKANNALQRHLFAGVRQ